MLEARAGVRLGQHDVYMNVAGGFRIMEPAADLAVAAALFPRSQMFRFPRKWRFSVKSAYPASCAPCRRPPQLKEAVKLGFTEALLPEGVQDAGAKLGLTLHPARGIADVVAEIAGGKGKPRRSPSISG